MINVSPDTKQFLQNSDKVKFISDTGETLTISMGLNTDMFMKHYINKYGCKKYFFPKR